MTFYLIGIDYKSSPIDICEEAYRNRKDIIRYCQMTDPMRTAILVTCNRIEIYGICDSLREARDLQLRFKSDFRRYFKYAYTLCGRSSVYRHCLRLACGLESQLRGEFQIFSQLLEWSYKAELPEAISTMWKDLLPESNNIRDRAGLSDNAINIANIVFNDIRSRISFQDTVNIMIIGTGNIARLLGKFKPDFAYLTFVAGKNLSKARDLAQLVAGQALSPKEMPGRIATADAIISATSSPHYVLKPEHFQKIEAARKKPLYIYDLAMPSDVAPEVEKIAFNNVFNLTKIIDDFQAVDRVISERLKLGERLIEDRILNMRDINEDTDRHAPEPAGSYTG